MTLISDDVFDKMFEDALQTYPDECCGFLFGYENDGNRAIIGIRQVTNISTENHRRRFSISPTDYIDAEKYAEENDLLLLGVYHSHPEHAAIPSETDRLAAQPFFSYVIVSVINNHISHVRSWQLNDENQFEEEEINQYSPVLKN